MMLMHTLCESRVTLKQFAAAVRGHNAQALPLMSSAPLDFPCVLFSLYCKSDRAALAELPNIPLWQPRGQTQTCVHAHAEGYHSQFICLNGGDGWGKIRLRRFNLAPSLYGGLTVDNRATWRFLRRPGWFHILLFFIFPDTAKSSHKFTPTVLILFCESAHFALKRVLQHRIQPWPFPRRKAGRTATHRLEEIPKKHCFLPDMHVVRDTAGWDFRWQTSVWRCDGDTRQEERCPKTAEPGFCLLSNVCHLMIIRQGIVCFTA